MKRLVKTILHKFGILKYIHRVKGYKFAEDINFIELENIQNQLVKEYQQKDKLKVAFFLYFSSTWKYDRVYKLMESDKNFEPIIVIIPMMVWDKNTMLYEMKKTYSWFKDRNYKVIKSYDHQLDTFLDVDKDISPDIVFYSEPYDATIKQYKSNTLYKKALICYSVYGFNMHIKTTHLYNLYFHNILWKNFAETFFSKKQSEEHAFNKGKNMIFTGAPACDIYMDSMYKPIDVWKDTKLKRVIYSPHYYTISSTGDGWATFIKNHQIMIDIAKEFKDKIYFVFKPHPYLKATLYKDKNWGKEKTDKYFIEWETMDNTHIELDDYHDLFLTSDGLIHDSGSFTFEYLYTKKPSMFLYKDDYMNKRWNTNAVNALEVIYKGYSKNDIVEFLDNVIINKQDSLREKRLNFVSTNLLPFDNKSASVNIIDILKRELKK